MKGKAITKSSGNVFADLGFDAAEAQVMAMRADLMIDLEKTIKAQKLTQAEAARKLGVTPARVSNLIRKRTEDFSLDMLVRFSVKLGRPARLKLG